MISLFSGKFQFLSNFYPCIVVGYDGKEYTSVEHAYQAAKSLKLSDKELIAKQTTAADAKKAGKRVQLRPDWESIKLKVMMELIINKFSNGQLRLLLLGTGNEESVEGNDWNDTFWGVCNGIGENWLGEILMNVREHLK